MRDTISDIFWDPLTCKWIAVRTYMWPLLYAFGQQFSRYLVLPAAAVVGTIGYYLEKRVVSKPAPIPYLETSIQEQRERRLAVSHVESTVEEQRKGTLHLNEPVSP